MRRLFAGLFSLLVLVAALFVPIAAYGDAFPKIVPLPNGWQPEGVASGLGTTFYFGSLANGAIYKGDFRTGDGAVFVAGQAGSSTGPRFKLGAGFGLPASVRQSDRSESPCAQASGFGSPGGSSACRGRIAGLDSAWLRPRPCPSR
jgi:hypothetical protein